MDKKKELEIIIPTMNLDREDNLKLREKILNMTSDNRKELRINKSTLWHIKKNLSEGKNSKIYDKISIKIK